MVTKKILFCGPESTGKSTLARVLASKLQATYVPEYARSYVELIDRDAGIEDVLLIYKKQLNLEAQLSVKREVLVCDTSVLELEMWMKIEFDSEIDLAKSVTHLKSYHSIFLCVPDFPYEPDVVRTNVDRRKDWCGLYEKFLNMNKIKFTSLKGDTKGRIELVMSSIE